MKHFWYDFGFTALMSYLLYLIIEAPLCGFDILLRPQRNPSAADQPKLVSNQNDLETRRPEESEPITASDVQK